MSNPESTLDRYLAAGADWISVHVEATRHLNRCLDIIRKGGARAGAAINPGTPAGALDAARSQLDYAVVMSVNPGAGGQAFIPSSIAKVEQVAREAAAAGQRFSIEVDGGVGPGNAGALVAAGAEILVAGTAVYGATDAKAAVAQLRAAALGGVKV